MQYECGAQPPAVTVRIGNRKCECLIPFMWCDRGTARGSIAEWFFCSMEWFVPLPRGLCSGKWPWSAFAPFFYYVGLIWTANKVSKMLATMMRDDYEKLNSSCNYCTRLWLAPHVETPLFYEIVHPKLVLSFGSSSPPLPPRPTHPPPVG